MAAAPAWTFASVPPMLPVVSARKKTSTLAEVGVPALMVTVLVIVTLCSRLQRGGVTRWNHSIGQDINRDQQY